MSLDEEEETKEDDLTEELINDAINDGIKEDKEELIKLDNELKHLSSNVLVYTYFHHHPSSFYFCNL